MNFIKNFFFIFLEIINDGLNKFILFKIAFSSRSSKTTEKCIPSLQQVKIDIVETKPSSVIQIIDKNINLDFDTPLDYVEPPKPKPTPRQAFGESKQENRKIESTKQKITDYKKMGGFVAFSGKGYRLGSN